MLTLTGYRTTANAIGKSPFSFDTLELAFSAGPGGWVNIHAKKASWGYHPGENRWSYGQAPSADAEVVAQILAAVREWQAQPALAPVAAASAGAVTRTSRPYRRSRTWGAEDTPWGIIPTDENGEF